MDVDLLRVLIQSVEYLLNSVWLLVVGALFSGVFLAHRRGHVQCSLGLALGCTAVLALILFPALSMTDDLQRAALEVETSVRHLSGSTLGALDDGQLQATNTAAALLLLVLSSRGVSAVLVRVNSFQPRLRWSGIRPDAVRPPPAIFA